MKKKAIKKAPQERKATALEYILIRMIESQDAAIQKAVARRSEAFKRLFKRAGKDLIYVLTKDGYRQYKVGTIKGKYFKFLEHDFVINREIKVRSEKKK